MTHRVTIYWKIDSYRVHVLQVADKLPMGLSLNGEQYLEVDDDQLALLQEHESKGLLEFRNKELIDTPHGLRPATHGLALTNRHNP